MKNDMKKRIVRRINVDVDKCIGCRACEVACSAFHARPRFSRVNPKRSRIRVIFDDLKDVYVPVRAGDYTPAECSGRDRYAINGKEYRECAFCRAACPSRDLFKDPETGLPLTCDLCESDPPLKEPMCVEVCCVDALTYEEREIDDQAQDSRPPSLETGLEALVDKYGWQRVIDLVDRTAKKG